MRPRGSFCARGIAGSIETHVVHESYVSGGQMLCNGQVA